MNRYIVASSKPWHRARFDSEFKGKPDNWIYVSTKDELTKEMEAGNTRYIFFLHWNWLVPEEIWSKVECVCFHMTDVPYGRGGSPLQNLIVDGQTETKVTALRMVKEMDAGPVYAKRDMSLHGRAEDIYLRAGEHCWEMIHWMVEEEPKPVPQNGDITLFKRRKPNQSVLPKETELSGLFDHIRMLDAPTYPLAFIDYGHFRMEFSHAQHNEEEIEAKVIIRKVENEEAHQ